MILFNQKVGLIQKKAIRNILIKNHISTERFKEFSIIGNDIYHLPKFLENKYCYLKKNYTI